jgi:hypothetical protein
VSTEERLDDRERGGRCGVRAIEESVPTPCYEMERDVDPAPGERVMEQLALLYGHCPVAPSVHDEERWRAAAT